MILSDLTKIYANIMYSFNHFIESLVSDDPVHNNITERGLEIIPKLISVFDEESKRKDLLLTSINTALFLCINALAELSVEEYRKDLALAQDLGFSEEDYSELLNKFTHSKEENKSE